MKTRCNRQSFQRLFLQKPLPDRLQHRHAAPGPLDSASPIYCQVRICDVVVQSSSFVLVEEIVASIGDALSSLSLRFRFSIASTGTGSTPARLASSSDTRSAIAV